MPNVTDTLLARNETYAAQHQARPPLPTLNTIVVSCVDARVDPAHILGLASGEAVVLRNAGGRVTEAVEQDIGLLIAMASAALGKPARPDIVLIHHTDCGMERLAEPEVIEGLSSASGIAGSVLERLAIQDHTHSLRADVERLASSPLVPKGAQVTGLRYDQSSGRAEVLLTKTL